MNRYQFEDLISSYIENAVAQMDTNGNRNSEGLANDSDAQKNSSENATPEESQTDNINSDNHTNTTSTLTNGQSGPNRSTPPKNIPKQLETPSTAESQLGIIGES